jgi:hypothetical protein
VAGHREYFSVLRGLGHLIALTFTALAALLLEFAITTRRNSDFLDLFRINGTEVRVACERWTFAIVLRTPHEPEIEDYAARYRELMSKRLGLNEHRRFGFAMGWGYYWTEGPSASGWWVRRPAYIRYVGVPVPLIEVLLLIVPIRLTVRRLRELRSRRRISHGLCERCGYDLRGSSIRCPECGIAIAGSQAGVATGLPIITSHL